MLMESVGGEPVFLGKWDATPSELPYSASNRFPTKQIQTSIDVSQYKSLSMDIIPTFYYSENSNPLAFDLGGHVIKNLNEWYDELSRFPSEGSSGSFYAGLSTSTIPIYSVVRTPTGVFAGAIRGRLYISKSEKKIKWVVFMCSELTQAIISDYVKFTIVVYGYKG